MLERPAEGNTTSGNKTTPRFGVVNLTHQLLGYQAFEMAHFLN
jgi:hypothetical protein